MNSLSRHAARLANLRFSASVTFLCPNEIPLEYSRALSEAGFSAVEFQLLSPGTAQLHAPHLQASGLAVALMNMEIGDFGMGGPGLSGSPKRAAEFEEALARARIDAATLGTRLLNLGPARVLPGMRRDECTRQFTDNICRAREMFAPMGISVAVEALNSRDYPDVLIRQPEEALELIDKIGGSGVVLQYDIYHAAVDGRDIESDILRFSEHLGHVQFADFPGRHEPGTGNLPFKDIFESLSRTGYQGYVGAEYSPVAAYRASFDWLSSFRRISRSS